MAVWPSADAPLSVPPLTPAPGQVHRCVLNVASDFYTGVRAALIHKSGAPAWVPASLKEASARLPACLQSPGLLPLPPPTGVAAKARLQACLHAAPGAPPPVLQVRPEQHVDRFFAPLQPEQELQLPGAPPAAAALGDGSGGGGGSHSRL